MPLHAGSSRVMACPGWSGLVDWRLHGWVLSHPVPQGTAAPTGPGITAGRKTLLGCFPNPPPFLPPGPLNPQLSALNFAPTPYSTRIRRNWVSTGFNATRVDAGPTNRATCDQSPSEPDDSRRHAVVGAQSIARTHSLFSTR